MRHAGSASTQKAAARASEVGHLEVRVFAGNICADGHSVTTINDLKINGGGQTLRKGTVIKSIRLIGDRQEID